jgi:copper resistance protein C
VIQLKSIFNIVIALSILLIPNSVLAHSGLKNSVPEANSTLTDDTKEIMLTFEGNIEETSSMEIRDESGKEFEWESISIKGETITGELLSPLPKGKVFVTYNVIGVDGHPIKGDFSFVVTNEPSTPQQGGKSQEDVKSKNKAKATNQVGSSINQNDKNEINGFLILIGFAVIAMFIVPAAALFFLSRKNKN